ncbi:MAG: GldG family protein [Nitrospinota bacterium]|nr:GldG family protein [Nitrospinota bacterium]
MKERTLRGLSLAGYTLLVVLIIGLMNLISYRHYLRVDLTEEGKHTLSAQTKKILGALDQKVTLHAFVRPDRNRAVAAFFEQYVYNSDKVTYEISDPVKSPGKAKKYNVISYDTFVVEMESGRREVAQRLDEQEITGKIVKALTEKQKKIYVLTGHGERDLEEQKPMGWVGAKAAILSDMFLVETLNWFETGKIPEDTDLLIIPGPKDDFQEVEINRLREYLVDGGKLLFALDPGRRPMLEDLIGEYGVQFADDMILDPLSQRLGFDPLVATVSSYEKGRPMTEELKAVSFFTVARSLSAMGNNKAGAEVRPIGTTAEQSWGETDMGSIDNASPEYSESEDRPGPLVVALTAEWNAGPGRGERKIGEKQKKGRLVAIGDSDFASNSMLGMSANKDLFLNMIAWLLESEGRISVRAKKPDFNPIIFTRQQIATIFWGCVVVIPVMAAGAGFLVFFRRRRP